MYDKALQWLDLLDATRTLAVANTGAELCVYV